MGSVSVGSGTFIKFWCHATIEDTQENEYYEVYVNGTYVGGDGEFYIAIDGNATIELRRYIG